MTIEKLNKSIQRGLNLEFSIKHLLLKTKEKMKQGLISPKERQNLRDTLNILLEDILKERKLLKREINSIYKEGCL